MAAVGGPPAVAVALSRPGVLQLQRASVNEAVVDAIDFLRSCRLRREQRRYRYHNGLDLPVAVDATAGHDRRHESRRR